MNPTLTRPARLPHPLPCPPRPRDTQYIRLTNLSHALFQHWLSTTRPTSLTSRPPRLFPLHPEHPPDKKMQHLKLQHFVNTCPSPTSCPSVYLCSPVHNQHRTTSLGTVDTWFLGATRTARRGRDGARRTPTGRPARHAARHAERSCSRCTSQAQPTSRTLPGCETTVVDSLGVQSGPAHAVKSGVTPGPRRRAGENLSNVGCLAR